MLRIYADFNSGGTNGEPCWLLRYGPDMQLLDKVADALGLEEGMTVTLYYADSYEGESEEFEVTATLLHTPGARANWQALPDWKTKLVIK